MKKREDILKNLWHNIHQRNNHIIGIPEEAEKKKGTENLLEEIIADFPNMEKETDIQIHEAQRVPNKRNPKHPHMTCSN